MFLVLVLGTLLLKSRHKDKNALVAGATGVNEVRIFTG